MDHKNIILGAGLAGLSAAYHLQEDYAIYEKQPEIGGQTANLSHLQSDKKSHDQKRCRLDQFQTLS